MKTLMETMIMANPVRLNFIERDTLLACLKDMIALKKLFAANAQTAEERKLCEYQAKTAQELYDRIYEQKEEEFEERAL